MNGRRPPGPRLGLCCIFRAEPVRFRAVTATTLLRLSEAERLDRASQVCLHNAASLLESLHVCRRLGIGAFRILSPLFPRMTHPEAGYSLDDLPAADAIRELCGRVRELARAEGLRLSFHPDQFVVLSSPDPGVLAGSCRELEYMGFVAELVGAEVINVHGGGAYGDPGAALVRLRRAVASLSDRVRRRLTLENDERCYGVGDLLPVCRDLGLPLVYDVHHHRCRPDGLSEARATELAAETWGDREPWVHVSSPRPGASRCGPHADYVEPGDVPRCWLRRRMTVDVEAKAKELAVVRLMGELGLRPWRQS